MKTTRGLKLLNEKGKKLITKNEAAIPCSLIFDQLTDRPTDRPTDPNSVRDPRVE
jgi:hypothetical protein